MIRLLLRDVVVSTAFVLAVSLVGCARDEAPDPASASLSAPQPPDKRALQPIVLPDFAEMNESVREQVQERHSALMLTIDDPAAAALDLANAYGELGKLLMAAEYYAAAESCYSNAHALAPNDARWPSYLGHLYRTTGMPAKSAVFFEKALHARPDDVATLVALGEVHLVLGRPEAAVPLFVRARALQPQSVAVRSGLGRAALAQQDYAGAVQHLTEALHLDPKGAGIHYPLAMAYRALGDPAKADAHLRQRRDVNHLPLDPLMQELEALVQSPVAYEARGTRALAQGDWSGAAAYFRKGIELAPANPSLRHRLGTALYMLGNPQGALEQFETAVRISPDFAKGHYSLGVLMEETGRYDEAVERFMAAIGHEPAYVEPRVRLAGLLGRSGRVGEALSQYEQILRIDPRVGDAQFGAGLALVRLRRYEEARDRFSQGMKANPDQPRFAHGLARLLAGAPDPRVRDGRRASEVMQALSDEQRHMDGGETIAMVLAELGRFEEAAAAQREAIAAAARAGAPDSTRRHMASRLAHYERQAAWRDADPVQFDF